MSGCNFFQPNLKAILCNCSSIEAIGTAIEKIVKTLYDLKLQDKIQVGAYANGFEATDEFIEEVEDANCDIDTLTKNINADVKIKDEYRKDLTPDLYLLAAQIWAGLGCSIIGGCCGVFPEHIKAIGDFNRMINYAMDHDAEKKYNNIMMMMKKSSSDDDDDDDDDNNNNNNGNKNNDDDDSNNNGNDNDVEDKSLSKKITLNELGLEDLMKNDKMKVTTLINQLEEHTMNVEEDLQNAKTIGEQSHMLVEDLKGLRG